MDKRFKSAMAKLLKIVFLATMQTVKEALKLGVHGAIVPVIAWKHLMKSQQNSGKKTAKILKTVKPIA